jgi:hypothetical protein
VVKAQQFPVAFPLNAKQRIGCGFLVWGLGESGNGQATVAFEKLPPVAVNGFGADGGEFITAVGFMENAVGDAQGAQAVGITKQRTFVGSGTNDQVGMRQIGGEKISGDLNGRMTGLNDLLRERKIDSDEEIDVRGGVLGELHGCSEV